MKLLLPCVVLVALVTLAHERPARANSACGGSDGWSPRLGETVPPRATLVFWSDEPVRNTRIPALSATIDGKAVKTQIERRDDPPYRIFVVQIDSDRTGKLAVAFEDGARATYTVKAGTKYPDTIRATTSRAHHELRHSTVEEKWDALAIRLDGPAALVNFRWRRDAKSAWQGIYVPAMTGDQPTDMPSLLDKKQPTALVGRLGCHRNHEVQLLEAGVEIEVFAQLPDGRRLAVDGLPRFLVLPK